MVTPYYALSICLKRFARTRLLANSALQSGDAALNVIVGNSENSVAQFSKLVSLLFISIVRSSTNRRPSLIVWGKVLSPCPPMIFFRGLRLPRIPRQASPNSQPFP